MNVSAAHKDYPQTQVYRQFVFTTGIPPSNGVVLISPEEGSFLETNFSISISNWIAQSPPLQFRVFIGKSESLGNERIEIT